MMQSTTRSDADGLLIQLGWWTIFLICALYGVFALALGVSEVLSSLGIAEAKHRAAPLAFVVHALAGAVALISGPIQLNRGIRRRLTHLHRAIGRAYVIAVWVASVTGLWVAARFDVSPAAKIVFVLVAILWFTTTTIGLLRIRKRRFAEHREWMMRSVSLSLFFVTFSLWVPGLASTNLPQGIAYPLAVFLSWSLNMAVAELWIRCTRSPVGRVPLPQGGIPAPGWANGTYAWEARADTRIGNSGTPAKVRQAGSPSARLS